METNRVVMSLLSEDGDQNYPGELNVETVFDFDDENALEITYLARTDKTTVVNLTNHVYFNLAGEGSGSVLDHQLRLNSSQVLEMNDKQIPTGRLLDAAGTPQDFREFRPFRPRHRLGVQPHPRFQGVRPPVRHRRLEAQHSGRGRLSARTDFGPLRDGAFVAAQRDDLHRQLARGRMPRNQVGRAVTTTTTAWRSNVKTTPTPSTTPNSRRRCSDPAKPTARRSYSGSGLSHRRRRTAAQPKQTPGTGRTRADTLLGNNALTRAYARVNALSALLTIRRAAGNDLA